MLLAAVDPPQVVELRLRRRRGDAVDHELDVAADGVERRAQLVAHHGEELRLRAVRLSRRRPRRRRARSRAACAPRCRPCSRTIRRCNRPRRTSPRPARGATGTRPRPRAGGTPSRSARPTRATASSTRSSARCRRDGRGWPSRSPSSSCCDTPKNSAVRLVTKSSRPSGRAVQTWTGIVSAIMPEARLALLERDGEPLGGVGAGAERGRGAGALDRVLREQRRSLGELQIGGGGDLRLGVVHREGAEHAAARVEDRRRPAGREPVREGERMRYGAQSGSVAMSRTIDALAPVHGGAARSADRARLQPVDRSTVLRGEMRRGTVAQREAVVVDEQDGAVRARRDALDQQDERVERLAQHGARHRLGIIRRGVVAQLGEEASARTARNDSIREGDVMLRRGGEDTHPGNAAERRRIDACQEVGLDHVFAGHGWHPRVRPRGRAAMPDGSPHAGHRPRRRCSVGMR